MLKELEGQVHRALAAPPEGSFADLVREQRLADTFIETPRGNRLDRLRRPLAAIRIARWARSNRKRLVAIHANALTGLNLSAPAAIVTRRPVITWVHDPVGSRWGRVLGPMLRWLIPDLRIASVSPTAESVAVANGLVRPGQGVIVPNPIDPEEVLFTRPEPHDRLTVGVLGGATRRKGFDLLPAIVTDLVDLPIEWVLYVTLVPGEENVTIFEELRQIKGAVVHHPGKTTEVREAYARCDIVLCPSRAESFCRVAAEAMMNGLPVVGSDIDPLVALLGDERAGLLFPSGDAAAAAAAIRRLLANPALAKDLGEEGRKRAARFIPDKITSAMLELYGLNSGSLP